MSSSADAHPGATRTTHEATFDAAAVAAATATTPQVFLADAVKQLASLLGVRACTVLLADGGPPVASIGLPGDFDPATPDDQLQHGLRSSWSVPLTLPDGTELGWFVAYSQDDAQPRDETLELATAFGSVIALGLDRLEREAGVAARYQAVVVALTSALDATGDFSGRRAAEASNLAQEVGRRLGLSAEELELIAHVAMLHDVGKLGVPHNVLTKPGPLDSREWALIREHPVIGERILSAIPGFSDVARGIRHQHERWDGNGYPDGLAGEQIPIASRIVLACQAWHAMTSDRPYRPAMQSTDALRELRDGAGSQFDPRVAQALPEILGDDAPPPAWSLSEERDRELAGQLRALAAELEAEDLFVFRRITGQLYSHLGGVGRGAGWAGNIELDSDHEHHLRDAVASGAPMHVELDSTGRIFGPYYGRSAVLVPVTEDSMVVFGSSSESLAGVRSDLALGVAQRAHALVVDVSPAKRLADELEVLSAVREVMAITGERMTDALTGIAYRARLALSVEYAAVATLASGEIDPAIGVSSGAWHPRESQAALRALARFAARAEELPILSQDVSELDDAPEGFRHEDGVSSIYVLPVGQPAVAVMLLVHAQPGLRGFTALCQRVASGVSDAAELVVRRAVAQERLRAENARLTEKIRTDALTGVASRAAWDDALFAEELHTGRSGSPVSVVIIDIDQLKSVNDEEGHAAGDELLRRSAALLAGCVRTTDMVARIGGDEFGVLLRYSGPVQAEAWCVRLEEQLRHEQHAGMRWSLGCASVPPYTTLGEAVDAADRRMYEMKLARRSGRGR